MKKIFIVLFMFALTSSLVVAVNMPGAPVYNNQEFSQLKAQSQMASVPSSKCIKEGDPAMDNLALQALQARGRKDTSTMNQYIEQMKQLGATNITPDIIESEICPITGGYKTITLTINSKSIKGTWCANLQYTYKGKQSIVGYCK